MEDWYDSGQCKDCFIPSFNYRPAGSGQYALSLTNFDQDLPKDLGLVLSLLVTIIDLVQVQGTKKQIDL